MKANVLHRYAPFLAVAALQLFLVTFQEPRQSAEVAASGQPVPSGIVSGGPAAPGDPSTLDPGTPLGSDGGGATGLQGPGGPVSTQPGAPGVPGAGETQVAVTATGQKVDQLGRPLEGDKSKCAPGGLLQEAVTLQSPPCMPKFEGDNGGATHQGVTADKIKVVVYYPEYAQGTQQVLAANDLAMTPERAREVHEILARFFNKHYEFYGRQLDIVHHISPAADAVALRAEAKAVMEQHKPFAVLYYAQGLMPQSLSDQFARGKVVNLGVTPIADDFFVNHSPYVWSQVIQGYRFADLAADYYCKRMWGKNATLAGDPTLRVQKRKLGIASSEDPNALAVAKRFMAQVTGGMCGSPADGTTLYTFSSDPDTAASQRPALVTRMKNDGITTVRGASLCADADQQQYFPENFTAEVFDDDFVGRVYAALCGPTQMANVFGIGMFPRGVPENQKEFYVAMNSVQPGYDPPYLAEGPFQGLALFSRMVQYAGPNLNPNTLKAGAHSIPQIGGWTHPNPFPGWKCCNPYTPTYHLGISPDSYSAKIDARQIYWDNAARSEGDGANGAWVGVDGSRRYRVGEWPAGEPKQP
jgi:hypothetical protein